ncbi:hypothetical protein D9758_009475 [Tetrapyrgos nigripes]|uniref:Uncharacterized protein n=1 Tax=Tetrapyrgos nigripes TaxID=182062 RepID=A0A8H5G154_9AGAR|nr:hypothetical protein D9758_009475 [Tetrapyrgos nigripes]
MDPEPLDRTTMDVDEPSESGQDAYSYIFMPTQNPNALVQRIAQMEKEERCRAKPSPSSPPIDRPLANVIGDNRSTRPRQPFKRRVSSHLPYNKNAQSTSTLSSADIFKAFQPAVMEQVTDIAKKSAMRRSRSSGWDGASSMDSGIPFTGDGSLDSQPGSGLNWSGKRKTGFIEGVAEKRKRITADFSSNQSETFGAWQPTSTSELRKGKMKALDHDSEPIHSQSVYDEPPSENFLQPPPPIRSLARQSTIPTLPDTSTNPNSGSGSTSFTSSSSLNFSVADESDNIYNTSETSYSIEGDESCPEMIPVKETNRPSAVHLQRSFDGYTGGGSKGVLSHSRSVPAVVTSDAEMSKSSKPSRSTYPGSKSTVEDNPPPSTERLHPLIVEQEQKRQERRKEKEAQLILASQQGSSSLTSKPASTSTPCIVIPQKLQAQTPGKYLGMRRPSNLPGFGTSTSSNRSVAGAATNKDHDRKSKTDQSPLTLRDVNGLPTRQKAFKTPFKTGTQGTSIPSSTGKTGAQVARVLSSLSLGAEREQRHDPSHGQVLGQRVGQSREAKVQVQYRGQSSKGKPQDVCMKDVDMDDGEDDDDDAAKDADSSFDISFGMEVEEVEEVMKQYDA